MNASQKKRLLEIAKLGPNFGKLTLRLLRDPRVPKRCKIGMGLLAAYLTCPFDLIPDFIPVIGYADDAILIAFCFGWLVKSAGKDLIREHWEGETDPITLGEQAKQKVGNALPWLRRILH